MTKFIYNPKTCRYEREGLNLWRALGLCTLVITISILFFISIATIHGLVWESEAEQQVRAENEAMKKHYALVKQQYDETEAQLMSLEEKDKVLKASLFNSIFIAPEQPQKKSEALQSLSDIGDLREGIHKLTEKTNLLKEDAAYNTYFFSDKLSGDRAKTLKRLSTTPSILPINNGKLISGFGKRIHPFHKGLYEHPGIDIVAPRGTEVIAAADGYVSDINKSDLVAGYGNLIEITHSSDMTTRYAHLENILVRSGQKIKKGQVIGTVGNSGGSIAPHLHYEVLKKGIEQNPIYYLLQNISPADYQQLFAISTKQNQSLD